MGKEKVIATRYTKILRKHAVLDMCGFSNSTLYAWISSGKFPKPLKLSPRLVGWRIEDVQEFLAAHAEGNASMEVG